MVQKTQIISRFVSDSLSYLSNEFTEGEHSKDTSSETQEQDGVQEQSSWHKQQNQTNQQYTCQRCVC